MASTGQGSAAGGGAPGPFVVGPLRLQARSALLRPGLADVGAAITPRAVDLLRTDDLLVLRCSFVNLRFAAGEADGPPVLLRTARNRPAFLLVTFPSQHAVEQAYFRSAAVPLRPPPRPTGLPAGTPAPTEPDLGRPQSVLSDPPVFASLSGPTRLAFRVRDEVIPYTTEGLLDAMSRLELSVAPHAAPPPAPLVVGSLADLVARGGLDLTVVVGQPRGRTRTRPTPPPSAAGLVAVSRLTATAAELRHRLGDAAALGALGTTRIGERIGASDRLGRLPPFRVTPPLPAPPSAEQTAIELPWRLLVSPHGGAAWAHSRGPVEHDGRVELWHTRLGTRTTRDGAPAVDELAAGSRTIRAVWARDFDQLAGFGFGSPPTSGGFPNADGSQDDPEVRTSLNSRDRMMLVHETSNFHLRRGDRSWPPPAVPAERLLLSALGGWLDSRVTFDTLPDGGLTVEEWKHVAALGRDHEVKVVYAGFLLPFGHRASLVKITERRFEPTRPGRPAYLFQRMFLIVREPEKRFTGSVDLGPEFGRSGLTMPLGSVTIRTRTTPDLDAPVSLPGGSGFMFVPRVGGSPVPFRIIAVDRESNLVEFAAPLVFMERDRNQQPALTAAVTVHNHQLADPVERRMPLHGQRLAFAASDDPDDTVLATEALTFDIAVHPDQAEIPQDEPRFLPVLHQAEAVVPAMSALAGAAAPVTLRYPAAYKTGGFAGNTAEVFLELTARAPLNFTGQADHSGGFVTPNLQVSALSRRTGPIGGTVDEAVGGTFDPASFFAGLDAKLFGVVALTDLLEAVGFDPAHVPRFIAQTLDLASTLTQNVARLRDAAGTLGGQLGAAATDLSTAAAQLLTDLAALAQHPDNPPDLTADLQGVGTALDPFLAAVAGTDTLPRPRREQLTAIGRRLQDELDDVAAIAGLLVDAAQGRKLPEVVTARLDWSTDVPRWPGGRSGPAGDAILSPVDPATGQATGAARLTLAVEIQAPTRPGRDPSVLVSCSLTPIDLRLIGPATFLVLHFTRLEFSVVPGAKPDVNVELREQDGVEFAGPLSFVNTLKDVIPFNGFSDPPHLDVTADGVEAGFDLAVPNLGVGILSLENINLGARFAVPFIGESLEVAFNFATREDPFRLSVMLFGGGGFFGVTMTPDGVRVLEAAFEFGASISVNLGVASGGVSVMAGIYFRLQLVDGQENARLTGYFRLRGEVDVLGLVSASIELYLELTYETATGKAVGRATLTIEIEIFFLSFSVEISCEKKFAGAAGDPTFVDQLGLPPGAPAGAVRPWDEYCRAFADA